MKSRMRRIFIHSFILFHLICFSFLFGCSAPQPPQPATKILKAGYTFRCDTIDPAQGESQWMLLSMGVGETLIRIDEKMQPQGWMVREWKNIDPNTWEFTLQPHLCFSDGMPLNAPALDFCFKKYVLRNERLRDLIDYSAAGHRGDAVFWIKTRHPCPALPEILSLPYALIYRMTESKSDNWKRFHFTGPFTPIRFVKDSLLALKKNSQYWAGEPLLEGIEVRFLSEPNTRSLALQNGEVDVIDILSAEMVPVLEKKPEFRCYTITTSRVDSLSFNINQWPFTSKAVRKAINFAIDREQIAQKALAGGAQPAYGLFSQGLPFSITASRFYAPQKAFALLQQEGWPKNSQGYFEKDGKELEFILLTYSTRPQLPIIAIMLQSQLRSLGIRVKISTVERVTPLLSEGNFQAALYSFSAAPNADPAYTLNRYFYSDSPSNFSRFKNDEMDRTISELNQCFEHRQRDELAIRCQQILQDELPIIFLTRPKICVAMSCRVKGFQPNPSGFYLLNAGIHLVAP